jgi:DNA adenine methylase
MGLKYMGSKARIADEILPIILKDRKPDQCYTETMVGGGNLIDKVDGWRIGADFNHNVILALEEIRDNIHRIPKNNKEFTELQYNKLKQDSKICNRHDIAFCGFAYSYGGKWFGGWCRDGEDFRDYVKEAYCNAFYQYEHLQDVELIHSSYLDLNIPKGSIIYCDPPYKDTTKYSNAFDHEEFWDWVRVKESEGYQVFISEYQAPTDFTCIWEKEIVSSLTQDTGSKKAIERLFTLNPRIKPIPKQPLLF